MARGDLLFAKYDLGLALLGQEKKIKEAIERIDANTLLNSSPDSLSPTQTLVSKGNKRTDVLKNRGVNC
jgi:hypothetical protein